jgi:hypothetical protein
MSDPNGAAATVRAVTPAAAPPAEQGAGPRAPLVLLDMDGVLNAIAPVGDRSVWPDWRTGNAYADGLAWPILFSPSVVAEVRAWRDVHGADVRWLTTWGDDANDSLRRLFGLPQLPVAARAPTTERAPGAEAVTRAALAALPGQVGDPGWWKLDAVVGLAAAGELEGRAVVWVDDDLRLYPDAAVWLRSVAPALTVSPRSPIGLEPRQLRDIEEFLAGRATR